MSTQLIIIAVTLAVFVGLGFMMNRSIKKYEATKSKQQRKKGRNKYMPEVKKMGR